MFITNKADFEVIKLLFKFNMGIFPKKNGSPSRSLSYIGKGDRDEGAGRVHFDR